MLRPCLREVTNLLSWMYCFVAYVTMRANDQDVRDMLAYARLVIREAHRHGGLGRLDYDRVFRATGSIRSRAPFRCRPESLAGICVSWNNGQCRFPNSCRFQAY